MASSFSINHAAMAAGLLLLWLAIVEGSSYRTLAGIAESVRESTNNILEMPGDSCQSLRLNLEECRKYVEKGTKSMPGYLRSGAWGREKPPHRCCQQLDQMLPECRCEAIGLLLKSKKHSGEDQMVAEVEEERRCEGKVQRAKSLPGLCGLSPHICHNITSTSRI